jgi:hypothetical protein
MLSVGFYLSALGDFTAVGLFQNFENNMYAMNAVKKWRLELASWRNANLLKRLHVVSVSC